MPLITTVCSWNTQGMNASKWQKIVTIMSGSNSPIADGHRQSAPTILSVQEAGYLSDNPTAINVGAAVISRVNNITYYQCVESRMQLYVLGISGCAVDFYHNNRVSLALVSRQPFINYGFEHNQFSDRGLLWGITGNILYGTYHEQRGRGGLASCLTRIYHQGVLAQSPSGVVVGGDFNDTDHQMISAGSISRGGITLTSQDYNSGAHTHVNSQHDLDRIFVSQNRQILSQRVINIRLSDHNPIFAGIG